MYRTVDLEIWGDDKFRNLSPPAPSGQMLWIYLLVGKHTTPLPGVICASTREICGTLRWPYDNDDVFDTRSADEAGYAAGCDTGAEAMAEIISANMAKVNERAGLIWLPKAIRRNPPHSANNIKNWKTWWQLVPNCDLKIEIYRAFSIFFEERNESQNQVFLRTCVVDTKGVPKGVSDPLSEGLSKCLPNPREQSTVNSKQGKNKNTCSSASGIEFDFEASYKLYPRKAGKAKGMEKLPKVIGDGDLTVEEDLERLKACVTAMAEAWGKVSKKSPMRTYIPYWSTFVNAKQWRDDEWPMPKVESHAGGFVLPPPVDDDAGDKEL